MCKRNLSLMTFSAGLLAFGLVNTEAKPMPPFPVSSIQSNGDTVHVRKHGDEYASYTETLDGHLLVQCGTDLCYANADGESSGIKAKDASARSESDKAFLNKLNKDSVRSLYINEKMPRKARPNYGDFQKSGKAPAGAKQKPSAGSWSLGEKTFIMILVNHSLKTWTTEAAKNFERMLNEEGYSDNGHEGSVRDYYIKQSGGKFKPTFKVFGPYTYNGAPSGNDPQVMSAVLSEAYSKGDLTSFSGYAQSSEGAFVGLVLAGNTADYNMSGTIYMGWMNTSHTQGQVGRYVYIPGMSDYDNSSIDGMGTFAHEFGHVLGLPDLYQTMSGGNTTEYLYEWDVMDVGCYNNWYTTSTGQIYGNHVPNMSSFEREWLGWHTPTNLPSTNGIYVIPSWDSDNFAYQIVDPSDSDQWFVLENRQQTNWDESLPGHGLLIWHIDYDQTVWDQQSVNSTKPYVDIEEASKTSTAAYSYPGTANVTSFNAFTNWNNQNIFSSGISNITEKNGYICFSVGGAAVTECPPSDYVASSSSTAASSSSVAASSSSVVVATSSSSEAAVSSSSTVVATEATELSYDVALPISTDYSTTSVTLDASAITTALGVSASNATFYGVNADGSLYTGSTANDPGHWFDKSGNVVDYGEGTSYVFAEWDMSSLTVKIGHYPNQVSDGDTFTIREALVSGNKQVTVTFHVTIGTTTAISAARIVSLGKIFTGKSLDLSPFAKSALQQGATLKVYDVQGNLVKTISSASEAVSVNQQGIFHAILKSGNRTLGHQTFKSLR